MSNFWYIHAYNRVVHEGDKKYIIQYLYDPPLQINGDEFPQSSQEAIAWLDEHGVSKAQSARFLTGTIAGTPLYIIAEPA